MPAIIPEHTRVSTWNSTDFCMRATDLALSYHIIPQYYFLCSTIKVIMVFSAQILGMVGNFVDSGAPETLPVANFKRYRISWRSIYLEKYFSAAEIGVLLLIVQTLSVFSDTFADSICASGSNKNVNRISTQQSNLEKENLITSFIYFNKDIHVSVFIKWATTMFGIYIWTKNMAVFTWVKSDLCHLNDRSENQLNSFRCRLLQCY